MSSIGIIGMDKGEGVTSLSIGLASFLHEVCCKKTALAEMNLQSDFEKIRSVYFGEECYVSPFRIFKIAYYPAVSKAMYAQINNMEYDCVVTDFGCNYQKSMEDFLGCDRKIVMGSINLWKYQKYLDFYNYVKELPGIQNWLFLLSGDEEDIQMLHMKHDISVRKKEYFCNPYHISNVEAEYYEAILGGKKWRS